MAPIPPAHWIRRLALLPAGDLVRGLDRGLGRDGRGLLAVGFGLLASWWLYVPLHELLHAAACAAAGGKVTRLEIDGLFGGALLARCFPFVVAGSDYAGRLAGFDPHGSDRVRLATDLGPFLLTLFPGVWALRRAARAGRPLLFGAALPFALAPFLSLGGDAYEIGAILVTRWPPWASPAALQLLRGDDLGLALRRLAAAGPHPPWGGAALAAGLGLAWALLTYGAGALVARGLGEPALEKPALAEPAVAEPVTGAGADGAEAAGAPIRPTASPSPPRGRRGRSTGRRRSRRRPGP